MIPNTEAGCHYFQVNNGFAALRQHIPSNILAAFGAQEQVSRGANKKLSKVETLRMAVEYIKSLQSMIEEHEDEVAAKSAISHQLQEQKSLALLETIKVIGKTATYCYRAGPCDMRRLLKN